MNPLDDSVACLFRKVREKFSNKEIAKSLGLHLNTVDRWEKNSCVPSEYRSDFKRMLGFHGDPDDRFYTKPIVASHCLGVLRKVLNKLAIDESEYFYLEPSAGVGSFLDLLPRDRRLGLDVSSTHSEVYATDYLLWKPEDSRKTIVVGNPPFGLRGHLALQFINHSAVFADVVAFILPQLFESDGKGVPAKRVDKCFKLAYSEKIPSESFITPAGCDISVNTVFQIWTKVNHDKVDFDFLSEKVCNGFVKIYSLSNGGTPASTRNKNMIGNCDIYLPSTCFKGMQSYDSFDELPNQRGYGLVIHKNKKEIIEILRNHDWQSSAFLSTNGALNLRTSIIEKVVIDKGFFNNKPESLDDRESLV